MIKNKDRYLNNKKAILFLSFCVLLILLLVTVLPNSFASLTPVKSISFESEKLSYEKNDAGSYKITKRAEWIGKGKARITFQVDTKELLKENINTDTILIIDTSGSMTRDKLDKVKSDSIDLINKILDNKENKIAIIEFNTNAALLSDFTNNVVELTDKINNLQATGVTSYYRALVKLEELLIKYQKEDNRELTVLFLTDGVPSSDTPNEVGQYKYLKSEYSYLNIHAVQYEMGNTILEEIKNISDKQFSADMNTLNNVLIDASAPRQTYNEFKITDYINKEYFKIENKEDITTSIGTTTLDKEDGKITWNLDNLSSGSSATMTIDVYLKEEYIDKFDLYKTNTKEEVTSEIDGIKENISKTDTPVLSNSFTVSYDGNAPEGCKVEGTLPKSKQYSVFNPVEIEDTTLTCDGYKFQGWEVVNKENVSMIGNDYFVSDGNDIRLKAIWAKVTINKSMDGTVYQTEPIIKEIPNLVYNGEFWNGTYRYNTTKIIIENELNPIEGATEFWDVSEANDESVMAYAVLNEDGNTYTIYIQGPGKVIANKNSSYLFSGFTKLESIEGLEYLDTSQATNMSSMFDNCRKLISLDLSSFDTSKVINMNDMFSYCSNLTSINLSNFDTSQVTYMNNMFNSCSNLTSLNLSSFDTSQVTMMSYMFGYCSNLTSLNLSNFDTSKVINMSYMFQSCSNLKSITLTRFNTLNTTHMTDMFQNCSSLEELDLSSFNMENVLYIGSMFSGCTNLKKIDLRNSAFNSATYYSNMFYKTSNLSVIVKDETARTWIQSRLGSNGTAIIAS
mgnify:CR=1 FL=1